MGRHSRGSGEPPAPLPDPPARHPYAPRSAEDTGDSDRQTYRVVDVGPPAGYGGAASVAAPGRRRLGTPLGRANRAGCRRRTRSAAVGSGFRAPDGFGADRREPRFGATRSDLVDSRPIAPTGESRRLAPSTERVPAGGADGASPGGRRRRASPGSAGAVGTVASRGSPPPQRVRPGSRSAAASRVSAPPGRIWSSRAPVGRLWTVASPASGPRWLSRASLASASPASAAPGSAVPGSARTTPELPPPPAPGPAPVRPEPRFGATRADLLDPQLTRRDGPVEPRIDLAEPRPGRRGAAEPRFGATRAGSRRSVGSTALAPRPAADPDEVTDTGARRARSRSASPPRTDERGRRGRPTTEDEDDEHEREPALILQWGDLRRPDADRRDRRPRRLARLLPALVDLAVLRRARGRRRRDRHAGARPRPAPPARPRPRPAHGRRHGRRHHRADRACRPRSPCRD